MGLLITQYINIYSKRLTVYIIVLNFDPAEQKKTVICDKTLGPPIYQMVHPLELYFFSENAMYCKTQSWGILPSVIALVNIY